jgi:hypothetical protein
LKIIWKPGKRAWWLIGSGAFVLLIYIAIRIFLSFYMNDVIKRITINAVQKASNGVYHIEIGNVGFDLPSRSITFENVILAPDTAKVSERRRAGDSIGMIFYAKVPRISMKTMHLLKAWNKQTLEADALFLENPQLRIIRNKDYTPKFEVDSNAGFDLSKIVPKPYKSIRFGKVLVNDAFIDMRDAGQKEKRPLQISHIYTTVGDLEIDKEPKSQHKKLYYAHSLGVEIRNYEIALPDSLHRFKIEAIGFHDNNLTIRNVQIEVDASMQKKWNRKVALEHIRIPIIVIDSIDIFKALHDDNLYIKNIRIDKPDIALNRPDKLNKAKNKLVFNPLEYLPSDYKSLQIGSMNVKQGVVSFYPSNNSGSERLKLKPVEIKVDNFYIDTVTTKTDERLFNCDNVRLWVPEFSRIVNHGLARLDVGKIFLSSATQKIFFQDVDYTQLLGKAQLGKKLGYSTDWINFKMDKMVLSGISTKDLIEDQQFIAAKCVINKIHIFDFKDKRLKEAPFKRKPLPSELLRKLDYLFAINSVDILHGEVEYEEIAEKGSRSGNIRLNDVKVNIRNFNNNAPGGQMVINLDGKLNGSGILNIKLFVPLGKGQQSFKVKGLLKDMAFDKLNSMAEPNMGVKMSTGYIRQMDFAFTAAEDSSFGTMHLIYHGLQIEITNPKKGETHGLKEAVGTFIVNNLILQSDNPKSGQQPRIGTIFYVRRKDKSFVNYTWNSILSGILSSVGIAELKNKADKKKQSDNLKQQIKDELRLRRQLKRDARKSRKQERQSKQNEQDTVKVQ